MLMEVNRWRPIEPLVLSTLINQSTIDWKGGLQQTSKVSSSELFWVFSAEDTKHTFEMKMYEKKNTQLIKHKNLSISDRIKLHIFNMISQ